MFERTSTFPSSKDLSASSLDSLMAQHDGLVHAVLRRQWGGTLSYEERLHAGRIGLWQALEHYDPTRGTTFSTYAWSAIARHIWRAVRLGAPQQATRTPLADQPPSLPLRPAQGYGSEPAPSLHSGQALDPDAALLQQEIVATLQALVERLPTPLRRVVIAYYGLADQPACSLRQIGTLLSLSHEAVRLRLWAALVWLRHPGHSLPLRQLLDLNTSAQYEQADSLAQAWLRKRGGRRGCGS